MSGKVYYSRPAILDAIPKDRHTVIEASAGTGKTFTIEHLFVELLLTQKVNIDNILVLTYTERAAGELRSRIRNMIERVLAAEPLLQSPGGRYWEIGPQEKVHLERALFSFDMAPIHTIHSFFQRVVNEHAFSSGRLFEQSLVDGKSAFQDAFLETLRKELSCAETYAPYLDAWLASGQTLDALHDELYSCHARKRTILPCLTKLRSLRRLRILPAPFGWKGSQSVCRRTERRTRYTAVRSGHLLPGWPVSVFCWMEPTGGLPCPIWLSDATGSGCSTHSKNARQIAHGVSLSGVYRGSRTGSELLCNDPWHCCPTISARGAEASRCNEARCGLVRL